MLAEEGIKGQIRSIPYLDHKRRGFHRLCGREQGEHFITPRRDGIAGAVHLRPTGSEGEGLTGLQDHLGEDLEEVFATRPLPDHPPILFDQEIKSPAGGEGEMRRYGADIEKARRALDRLGR